MTAKKLDSILNEMLREITIIKTNWTMWKGLKNELHKGAEYEAILGYSPCFWTVTLNNLLDKALLGTAKLYDEHDDCFGLKKLINVCEQNQKLFPKCHELKCKDGYTGEEFSHTIKRDISAKIEVARQKYQSLQDARTQLITLRDKHLAHTDKSIILEAEKLYQEVALKGEVFEKLIDTAAEITNSFLSTLSNTAVHIGFQNADDYKTLLHYAKEGKEAYLQKIKSRLNHET